MNKEAIGSALYALGCYALGAYLGYRAGKAYGQLQATTECTKLITDATIDMYQTLYEKSKEKEEEA